MSDATRIVYVVEQDGYVKIGSSTNLKARLSQLQTGCAVPLRLLGTCSGGFAREKALHREFGAWRRHGEWFKFPPEVLATLLDRVTVTTRPQGPSAAPLSLHEWTATRNKQWDQRRKSLQRMADNDHRDAQENSRYRRLRQRRNPYPKQPKPSPTIKYPGNVK